METLQTLEKASLDALAAVQACNKEIGEVKKAISDARGALEASDYKRHKNAEYAAVGLELPYSWEGIHAEAQAHRDIINENEPKIEPLIKKREALKEELKSARAAYTERLKLLNLPPYQKEETESDDGETWSFETTGS